MIIILYTHDIPRSTNCKTSLFANDTVNFASDRFIKRASMAVIKFYRKWKIKINTEKTVLMFHTKRRTRQLPPDSIVLDNVIVPRSNSVKYLGFHLDNRLTIKDHVGKTLLKADNICKAMYPYVRRQNMLTKKVKVKIYKTYIRPALLYGAPLLASVAKCHRRRLQVTQNKFLRMALNKEFRTRISSLHDSARLELVDDHLRRLRNKFVDRSVNSLNPIVENIGNSVVL